MTVEALAQEIRRHVGNHALGTDDLATALLPFIERHIAAVYACPECGTGMEVDPTAKAQPPKPAGAVALPEPDETEDTGDGYILNWYNRSTLIRYGEAREAAARAAVAALAPQPKDAT